MCIEYQTVDGIVEVLLNGVCIGTMTFDAAFSEWISCDGDAASTLEECARMLLSHVNW